MLLILILPALGQSLKTALFKKAELYTDDVIIKRGTEESGLKKRECAAKCLKKAYKVRTRDQQD